MDINDIVFVSSPNRLPFTSYNEINATIQYDTKLKSLLYGKMMFIAVSYTHLPPVILLVQPNPSIDSYTFCLNLLSVCILNRDFLELTTFPAP